MRKLLLVCIINILYADNYELKLYENILTSIFKTPIIKVYTDIETLDTIKDSIVFMVVKSCKKADLFLGKNLSEITLQCDKIPIFATNYRTYKYNKNSFGAFYWRKGRPQIKFKNDIIKKFNLNLPDNLRKYTQ